LRVFTIAIAVFGLIVGANVVKAGPSMTNRDLLVAYADPAIFEQEATYETEALVELDKGSRRDVQRRLTRLGFDTKVNGRFDKSTRAGITQWQAARGYPTSGFLSTLQHQALLSESVSAARASLANGVKSDGASPRRRRGGGGAHHHRSGPGGLIGGMVIGLFGRR
jgi:inactivated superfamily I helicase